MKMLSSFTHPPLVTNLCTFRSSAEHKRRYSEVLETVVIDFDSKSIICDPLCKNHAKV